MSKKSLYYLVRSAIFIVALCGLCICGCLYPFLVSLNGFDKGSETVMWSQLIFYWISSIPCFIILGIAWRIAASIKTELFTHNNAKLLKSSALLLFADSIVFFVGNFVFMFMGYNPFAIAFFMLVIVALIASLALAVVGHYLTRATTIREENESYV